MNYITCPRCTAMNPKGAARCNRCNRVINSFNKIIEEEKELMENGVKIYDKETGLTLSVIDEISDYDSRKSFYLVYCNESKLVIDKELLSSDKRFIKYVKD